VCDKALLGERPRHRSYFELITSCESGVIVYKWPLVSARNGAGTYFEFFFFFFFFNHPPFSNTPKLPPGGGKGPVG